MFQNQRTLFILQKRIASTLAINKIIPVSIALIQPTLAKKNGSKPPASSLNLLKRIVMPSLPLEIWRLIFSYMDFTLLQKIATLVCYEWLYIIRNDRFLSGHLLVSRKGLNVPDINLVLQNWPALKAPYINQTVKPLILFIFTR